MNKPKAKEILKTEIKTNERVITFLKSIKHPKREYEHPLIKEFEDLNEAMIEFLRTSPCDHDVDKFYKEGQDNEKK